jgi:hypothetical protein
MKVYPETGYQTWLSEDEADEFFETRINSEKWDSSNKEAALVTAFNDISLLLNLNIDLSEDETPLPVLKAAQAEQALYLVTNDLDNRRVESVNLGSGLYVKLGEREPRIAANTVEILSNYIVLKSVERYR